TKEARHELARLWSAKGYVYERKGEYRKAIEWQEKALGVFEKAKAEKEMANAIHRIGTCYWYLGEYEKAMEFFSKALGIREKINDSRGLAATYNNIGIIYHDKGEYEKALEFYTKSLELREKIGDVGGIAISYDTIGILYQDKGAYEKALEFFTKSIELAKKIGDKSTLCWGLLGMAACYLELKDFERCRKTLEEAKGIVSELSSKELEASFLTVSGKLLVAEGTLGEGEKALAKAVGIYESAGRLDTDYHKTLFELGRLRRDRELLEKALEFFEKIGNKGWAEKVREEIGKL
ncbi:MAG: tetratricopeptide repeat protein, partial [Thermoplasmata archaeon]